MPTGPVAPSTSACVCLRSRCLFAATIAAAAVVFAAFGSSMTETECGGWNDAMIRLRIACPAMTSWPPMKIAECFRFCSDLEKMAPCTMGSTCASVTLP